MPPQSWRFFGNFMDFDLSWITILVHQRVSVHLRILRRFWEILEAAASRKIIIFYFLSETKQIPDFGVLELLLACTVSNIKPLGYITVEQKKHK